MVIYLNAHSCGAIYRMRESKSKLELFCQLFIEHLIVHLVESRKNCSKPPWGGRTQFSRALLLIRFSMRTRIAKTKQTCCQFSKHLICRMPALIELFFFMIECRVLIVFTLSFIIRVCWKRYWCKKPSNCQGFLCNWRNPVKCNACIVSQKLAIECRTDFSDICLFLENHSLAFHEICHTLRNTKLEYWKTRRFCKSCKPRSFNC